MTSSTKWAVFICRACFVGRSDDMAYSETPTCRNCGACSWFYAAPEHIVIYPEEYLAHALRLMDISEHVTEQYVRMRKNAETVNDTTEQPPAEVIVDYSAPMVETPLHAADNAAVNSILIEQEWLRQRASGIVH